MATSMPRFNCSRYPGFPFVRRRTRPKHRCPNAFASQQLLQACGTGENALHVASLGLSVLGIDVAETALALARQKAADRGLEVEFVAADALFSITCNQRLSIANVAPPARLRAIAGREAASEKLRYMHRNPVKRELVLGPEDSDWSSFRAYLDGERGVGRGGSPVSGGSSFLDPTHPD